MNKSIGLYDSNTIPTGDALEAAKDKLRQQERDAGVRPPTDGTAIVTRDVAKMKGGAVATADGVSATKPARSSITVSESFTGIAGQTYGSRLDTMRDTGFITGSGEVTPAGQRMGITQAEVDAYIAAGGRSGKR